jgi:Zn-dependent peptidase ImmA (M78 family)
MVIRPEVAAERLLSEQGITQPPVPVDALVERLGIQVVYEPFEGELSGILYQEGDRAIIAVNARNHRVRQRFTIAHECGHYVLHQRERDLFVDKPIQVQFRNERSSLAVSREEITANRFAAALLMPHQWVIEEANRRLERNPSILDADLVADLARLFDVSQQAMEFRLAHLGVWAPL